MHSAVQLSKGFKRRGGGDRLSFEESICKQGIDEARLGGDSVQGWRKPLVSHMRVSWLSASMLVPVENQMELDLEFWSRILVGYIGYSRGLLDLRSS